MKFIPSNAPIQVYYIQSNKIDIYKEDSSRDILYPLEYRYTSSFFAREKRESLSMNLYFVVMDRHNRLVFKKKLEKDAKEEEVLIPEYQKLDFVSYILKGKTFAAALSDYGMELPKESAFLTKKDLKETLYFTDKSIKELLGQPDQIVKSKGSGDKFAHLYSKTRIQSVLESSEYKALAAKVKEKREEKKKLIQPAPATSSEISYFREKRSGPTMLSSHADKEMLEHLISKIRKDWSLNEYKDFFSIAREQKRKHVFFVGPTNSGKSYRGFNELVMQGFLIRNSL